MALVHKSSNPTILLNQSGGSNARSPQEKQKSQVQDEIPGHKLEPIGQSAEKQGRYHHLVFNRSHQGMDSKAKWQKRPQSKLFGSSN